jgi:hypothetical protein
MGSSHMQLLSSVKEDLAPLTVRNFGIGWSQMDQAADLWPRAGPASGIQRKGDGQLHALADGTNLHSALVLLLVETQVGGVKGIPHCGGIKSLAIVSSRPAREGRARPARHAGKNHWTLHPVRAEVSDTSNSGTIRAPVTSGSVRRSGRPLWR